MACYMCGEEIEHGYRACHRCAMRELPKVQIETSRSVDRCSTCLRYSVPPSGWTVLGYEENNMLRYLLKKIPELARYKLVKAEFAHSEEHSKRLRLSLHLDRSAELAEHGAYEGVVEEVGVVWVIKGKHCLDCAREASKQTWSSVVQLRQKSANKSTLLLLEQAILGAGLHSETTDIKGVANGIDFFYKHRTPALRLVRFVEERVPALAKGSEQLVKMDKQSAESRYKFAYSVEIPSINRHDLVFLPEKLARGHALARLCAVIKVTKLISLVDCYGSLKDINKIEYFKHARHIQVLGTEKQLVPFTVVEVEGGKSGAKKAVADNVLVYGQNATRAVTVLKEDGSLERTNTFVSGLEEEETVLGYDLTNFHTELDLNSSLFLVKKELKINENWRIKRLTQPLQGSSDPTGFRALLEEIKHSPQLRRTVEVYDEYNRLVKDFSQFKVTEIGAERPPAAGAAAGDGQRTPGQA